MTGTGLGTGCMAYAGKSGWYLLKAVYFIVGAFVFSYIFWWTKGLVEKCSSSKKKRKR